MVSRVNLSLDDKLFKRISEQAAAKTVSPNNEIISILENIFFEEPFDFSLALNTLINETQTSLKDGEEFLLNRLPSFNDICTGKINDKTYNYVPLTLRARLGLDFQRAVKKGLVPNVMRAKDSNDDDKVIRRTAIYKYK